MISDKIDIQREPTTFNSSINKTPEHIISEEFQANDSPIIAPKLSAETLQVVMKDPDPSVSQSSNSHTRVEPADDVTASPLGVSPTEGPSMHSLSVPASPEAVSPGSYTVDVREFILDATLQAVREAYHNAIKEGASQLKITGIRLKNGTKVLKHRMRLLEMLETE